MGLFEPRKAREHKGKGGKQIVGFWATQEEHRLVRALAEERGHQFIADYFRTLIRDDITRNGDPDERA